MIFKSSVCTATVLLKVFFGKTLNVISVKATNVPKDPVTNLERSYPVTFFTTVPPDLIISPFPLIPLKPRTWSLTLPTLNLLEPEKLVDKYPAAVPLLDFEFSIKPKSIG